jgi:hypothetical protein
MTCSSFEDPSKLIGPGLEKRVFKIGVEGYGNPKLKKVLSCLGYKSMVVSVVQLVGTVPVWERMSQAIKK